MTGQTGNIDLRDEVEQNIDQSIVQPLFFLSAGILFDYKKFCWVNSQDAETTMISLLDGGIKTTPLVPFTCNLFHKDCLVWINYINSRRIGSFYRENNIGIELGRYSKFLFAVKYHSKEIFAEECLRLGDLVKWVFNCNDEFIVLLFSKDGEVENIIGQHPNYDIQGTGFLAIPPSLFANGVYAAWIFKEGEVPPVVDREEIRCLFPSIRLNSPRTMSKEVWRDSDFKQPLVRRYFEWGQKYSWDGFPKKYIARSVWTALCNRADEEQPSCFRAVIRELADLSQISETIIHELIRKFVRKGFIERVERTQLGTSYKFCIILPSHEQELTLDLDNRGSSIIGINHDAFGLGALNKSGREIYLELLKKTHFTKMSIAKTCNLSWPTVNTTLKLLIAVGLVEGNSEMGYKAISDSIDQLDFIAELCQTNGTIDRKKLRHKMQRENRYTHILRNAIIERLHLEGSQ